MLGIIYAIGNCVNFLLYKNAPRGCARETLFYKGGVKVRIALLELLTEWEDKETNWTKLESVIDGLKDAGIDLLLLPEMSFTGFSMNVDYTKEETEYTIARLMSLSLDSGVALGAGWVKSIGDKCENHYSIVDGDTLVADYAKIHPFCYSGEDEFFEGGKSIVSARLRGFKIGIQICYDLRFPATFEKAANKADLMIVPANWPAKRSAHWKALLKARAIENQVYVAGVNCVGDIGGLTYSGDSRIINPDGNQCRTQCIKAGFIGNIYIADLNNDTDKYRQAFPVRNDRVYGK